MKIVVTLLTVLALLVLGIVGVRLLSDGDPAATTLSDVSEATGAAGAAPEEPRSREIDGPESTGEASADDAGRSAGLASREEDWDAAASVRVAGRVTRAGACGDDDHLYVYGLDERTDAGHFAEKLRAGGENEDGGGTSKVLARRAVTADGSFELPFPPGTTRAHVMLMGRFLYTPRSLAVNTESGEGQVTIVPKCGAAIEGRLIAPAGGAPDDLTQAKVVLAGQLTGFVSSDVATVREARPAADGRFSIQAVPTSTGFTLSASPEKLAAQRVELGDLEPGRVRSIEIRLTRGATVEGRVVDSDGVAVDGAEVEGEVSGGILARGYGRRTATSGAGGAFRLEGLAAREGTLKASKQGFLESGAEFVDLAEGEVKTGIVLALDGGNSVSGGLSWPDGTPAAGVKVRARFDLSQMFGMGGINAARGAKADAETGEDGCFRLTGLGKGPFVISAAARPPAEIVDALLGAAGVASGKERSGGGENGEQRVFDADWVARVAHVQPGATKLQLVFQPPRGVAGRVVDEAGGPVTSFRIRAVQLLKSPIGNMGRDQRSESFEDEGGRFFLSGMEEGDWQIFALADGFGLPDPVELSLPEAEQNEVTIEIVRAAVVSGRVLSPNGAPVAEAKVTLDSGKPEWMAGFGGMPEPPSAHSATDGSFVIEDMTPGKATIFARAEGYARGPGVDVEAAPGERVDEVELLLTDGGTLTGEVYSQEGRPTAGTVIQVIQLERWDIQFTQTDGDGGFRVEHLAAGQYQINALPSQEKLVRMADPDSDAMSEMVSSLKTAVVEIVEGESEHVVLGAPPEDPVRVRGTITHAKEPQARMAIAFYSEGKDLLQKMRRATTDQDGRYEVTLDGPGKYVATVQKLVTSGFGQQTSIEFQVEIPETTEHELDLELPLGRISGRVRGGDGVPVADERVTLYPAGPTQTGMFWGGQYAEVQTDDQGNYDVQGLRPGRYQLSAGGMAIGGLFGNEARHGRAVLEVDLSEGEWMEHLDIRLELPGSADLSVVDPSGGPVSGATVFARDEQGRMVELFSMKTTDKDGACTYAGLAPGRYTFSARKDAFASAESSRVQVRAGEVSAARVVLEEGTILYVKLVDAEGEGVQASVSVLDADGREVGTMIGLNEIFSILGRTGFSMTERQIGPLAPGSYQVIATHADGRVVKKPVTLHNRPERRLTLKFKD